MAEKIFNTRILNKIDTLENWSKSTLKIKNGEICLATVAASAGTGLEEPVIMAKIGTAEEKTFAELPWSFHAKASDVLAACKSEASLKAFVNSVIADAGIASDDAMQELAGRVTAVEGLVGDTKVATQISDAIAALDLANTYDAKGAAADALDDAKEYADGLNTAMNTRVEALEAIDHSHANAAELDKIADGDVAKWNAAEQNAKDYADGLNTEMDGRVADLEAMFGDGEGTVEAQIAAAVSAEKERAEAAEKANADAIDAIEADYLKAADKTALQEQITSNDNDILALQGLVGDTKVATQISDAVAAEAEIARAAEKANADAIEVLNSNAETEGSVDYKIAQKFATLMENPDEAMNSIQDLVDWTTEHAADALEMSNQVTANKNAIATLNGDASTAGSVDKKIADAIAAENLSQYATDTELTSVDDRLKLVEAAVGESGSVAGDIDAALAEAKKYTDDEVKELADGAVATNAANIAALQGLVGDTKVATQISDAIAALAIGDYAKAADLTAEVNRAKAAEEANAAAAKAAQDAADAAQGEVDALEIKVGTIEQALGLKANDADLHAIAKSGNVNDLVQTEGDVLIFDCGGSAV